MRLASLVPSPRDTLALVCLLVLAGLPLLVSPRGGVFLINFGTRVMIFAIAAISLDFILGYGGMVSFGHAVYIGIGGYAVAVLSYYGIDNGWLQFAIAALGSGLLALAIGVIALRTSGVYFIMITLGLTQMLYYVGISLSQFGGDDGFRTHRSVFAAGVTLGDPLVLYYLAFGLLLLAMLGLRRIVNSRFGTVLRASKSNERRARSLGVATFPYKLTAFVLAGVICGLAGALYVNLKGFMTPDYMHWVRSGDLLVMLLMGGQGTLLGGLVGAALFQGIETFLPDFIEAMVPGQGQNWEALFGPFLILLVLFFKGGLINAMPLHWPTRR
jgi:branched-chain amino acid transport system permease protein